MMTDLPVREPSNYFTDLPICRPETHCAGQQGQDVHRPCQALKCVEDASALLIGIYECR